MGRETLRLFAVDLSQAMKWVTVENRRAKRDGNR